MSNEKRYKKVVFFPKNKAHRPMVYRDVSHHDIERLSKHGTFDLDPDMANLERYPIKYWRQEANNKVIVPKKKIALSKTKLPLVAVLGFYAKDIYEAIIEIIKSLGIY